MEHSISSPTVKNYNDQNTPYYSIIKNDNTTCVITSALPNHYKCKHSETCLNQTLNKPEACKNRSGLYKSQLNLSLI